jgi:hypothetical protein
VVITIQIPDGVNVQVSQGQQQAASKPFVERPDPPYPGGVCPVHGTECKKINAGFSKTKKNEDGSPKRFNAFFVCSEAGCDEKPGQETVTEDLSGSLPF